MTTRARSIDGGDGDASGEEEEIGTENRRYRTKKVRAAVAVGVFVK